MKSLAKYKHSILTKYILSFIIPIAIFSFSFSAILYFFSESIVNKHVLGQFDENLELLVQEAQKDIDPTVVEEANDGEKAGYQDLQNSLNKYVEEHDSVELVYVLAQDNGKSYIVGVKN